MQQLSSEAKNGIHKQSHLAAVVQNDPHSRHLNCGVQSQLS